MYGLVRKIITFAGQKFARLIIISHNLTNIFVVRYQTSGNYFTIQILNLSSDIKFKLKEIILNINKRKVFFNGNPVIPNLSADSPIKLQKNASIIELSDFYNNISVDKTIQNQSTA